MNSCCTANMDHAKTKMVVIKKDSNAGAEEQKIEFNRILLCKTISNDFNYFFRIS